LMLYVPGGDGQSLIDYARAQAEEELEGVLTRVPETKVAVNRRLANGRPHKKIIEIIEGEAFDLVVMGTHGRTGLTHLILGSVAEKVIRRSPVPVLTVGWKPPEDEEPEAD
ncbi:MAG: universal stress protein, partial [Myxococcales bacterium]|nr:universal stress protein [Myxococcales bacterium]